MSLTDDAMDQIGKLVTENQQLQTERDGAYSERAHLVAFLAAQYPSVIACRPDPKPTDDDWPCVYIDLPTGQASWHVHPDDLGLFKHVTWMGYPGIGVYDGHTTEEKYQRLDALTRQLVDADEEV